MSCGRVAQAGVLFQEESEDEVSLKEETHAFTYSYHQEQLQTRFSALKFCVTRESWVRDNIPDIGHSGYEQHQPFEA